MALTYWDELTDLTYISADASINRRGVKAKVTLSDSPHRWDRVTLTPLNEHFSMVAIEYNADFPLTNAIINGFHFILFDQRELLEGITPEQRELFIPIKGILYCDGYRGYLGVLFDPTIVGSIGPDAHLRTRTSSINRIYEAVTLLHTKGLLHSRISPKCIGLNADGRAGLVLYNLVGEEHYYFNLPQDERFLAPDREDGRYPEADTDLQEYVLLAAELLK